MRRADACDGQVRLIPQSGGSRIESPASQVGEVKKSGAAQSADRLEAAPSSGGVRATPRKTLTSRIRCAALRVGGAVTKGVAIAMLVGALATSAFAQNTDVGKSVPLRPVAVQAAQQRDPKLMDRLTTPRPANDLKAHLDRAANI